MGLKIKKLNNNATAPKRSTPGSAGLDLYACHDVITLCVGDWQAIPTGIAVEIPEGHVGLICPRSGLAYDKGITVLNGPGVVDSDFVGEVKVLLVNHGFGHYEVKRGDRIAQLVIVRAPVLEPILVQDLDETARGSGGFGSTGR